MSVTLCFDYGNTRKKVAVFHDTEMKEAIALQVVKSHYSARLIIFTTIDKLSI